jgi:hypothetical protein
MEEMVSNVQWSFLVGLMFAVASAAVAAPDTEIRRLHAREQPDEAAPASWKEIFFDDMHSLSGS